MRAREIEIGWTSADEQEYRVTLSYSPGSPGRTHGEPGDCYPPEGPEFDVVRVVEDRPNGRDRPDLIDAVASELDGGWGDEVAEEADDDEAQRYAAHLEDRADAIRDERRTP